MSNEKITFGILTVSDRCYNKVNEDKSGDNLSFLISEKNIINNSLVVKRQCVPDEEEKIIEVLKMWTDNLNVQVILITGGTGFGPRDVTPEATKKVIEREALGLSLAMLKSSLEITPFAMLSRAVCGIRKNTLIINLPGSKKASQECFEAIVISLPHAVALLRNDSQSVDKVHIGMQGAGDVSPENYLPIPMESKVDVDHVAKRERISPFPLVSLAEAQKIILDNSWIKNTEIILTTQSLGRCLAEDIDAKDPLPPFRASIKDGYAVLSSDGSGSRLVRNLPSTAGSLVDQPMLNSGECVRINTGAPLPPGADAVVQVEDTKLIKDQEDGRVEVEIEILTTPVLHQEIREIGSDIEKGRKVLAKNKILSSSDLALLATVGVKSISVFRLPNVAILSTGNEIQDPFEPLREGLIRDSNKIHLISLLQENGFDAQDMGIAEDNPQTLLIKLKDCMDIADVIITSGGVSMGEKDYIKSVLTVDFNASIHFGRVSLKPGKPSTFATCIYKGNKKLILGLPGNPVSACVTCHLFVLPLLRKMNGILNPLGRIIKAKINKDIKLDTRPEYQRAILEWDDDIPIASITGHQISSRLLSVSSANALIVCPPKSDSKDKLIAGSIVDALLINTIYGNA